MVAAAVVASTSMGAASAARALIQWIGSSDWSFVSAHCERAESGPLGGPDAIQIHSLAG